MKVQRGLRLAILTGLVLLFLAGCTAKTKTTDAPTSLQTSTTGTSTSTESHPPPVQNQTSMSHLHLTNCTSWSAVASFPVGLSPGQQPPGWNPAPQSSVLTSVAMFGYKCNRISLAGFERGPVTLLIDSHTNADFPSQCTGDKGGGASTTSFLVASSFWIDDQDLAGVLNTTYGLPAYFSQFQTTDQATGALTSRTWTWGQSSQSTMTILDDSRYDRHPDWTDNFYWARGDGIGSLQLAHKGTASAGPVFNRPIEGTFQPPMLLASLPDGHYADNSSEWFPSVSPEGSFSFYKDRFCKEPGDIA